jgi:hypothetical protein
MDILNAKKELALKPQFTAIPPVVEAVSSTFHTPTASKISRPVVVDLVKRRQFVDQREGLASTLDVTSALLRNNQAVNVAEDGGDEEELKKKMTQAVTQEELALLAIRSANPNNVRFDLTRGSIFAEHIRHLFPCHDFSGGIPPFSDTEVRAMFNRRPRFLNFVTENNPHGFDVTVLNRLAGIPETRRHIDIEKQIKHRYWHLRKDASPKAQPKVVQRMYIHRNLNPRFQLLKNSIQGEIHKTHKSKKTPNSPETKEAARIYSEVTTSQEAIVAKMEAAGLSPEEIKKIKRLLKTNSNQLFDAALASKDRSKLNPIMFAVESMRSEFLTEGYGDRRDRLKDVFTTVKSNLDNPARLFKALELVEGRTGETLMNANVRKQLEEEAQKLGPTEELKITRPIQTFFYQHSTQVKEAERLSLQRAKQIARASELFPPVDDDDVK